MSVTTFDKLAFMETLKSAGVPEVQARAHVLALDDALRDAVATQADLVRESASIRGELAREAGSIRKELAQEAGSIRKELAQEAASLRGELTRETASIRQETASIRQELTAVEHRLETKIIETRGSLEARIEAAKADTLKAVMGMIYSAVAINAVVVVGAVLGAMIGLVKLLGH